MSELEKYLLAAINQDTVLALVDKDDDNQVVHDEGICAAMTTGFIARCFWISVHDEPVHTTKAWQLYFGDKSIAKQLVSAQVGFREIVLKDIDKGYDSLFGNFLLKKTGELTKKFDCLGDGLLSNKGDAILITFTFGEGVGHGYACFHAGASVLVLEPNEGVFKLPTNGWAAWIQKNLTTEYGKVTLMTIYALTKGG